MTIAILATGDEIVHGDTLNTNSRDIAHILSSEGLSLGLQMACSDKKTDIVNCLEFLAKNHEIIIIIGGLGPTTDDLTRFALAKYTGDVLVQHPEALDHIKKRLHSSQAVINEGNLQQCLFPPQAKILPNPNGSAVGCYYQWNNRIFILLPGPPRECLPMFNNHALPFLLKMERSTKQIIKWRIFGLAESEIAQTLEEALADIDCQTGYRLDVPYIEFKVRCTRDLVETIKGIIDPILSPHIIASVDKKASDNLRELIIKNNEPITIIDEATEGLLQSLLIKPGNQHLINFHNLRSTQVHFHLSGLEEYWLQQPPKGTTQLTIHYSNQIQEGGETHQIPYRSPLVVYYAAEWLSFRLFHLINQLHQ
ncbi:competence/damage-inducible protein A [Legionella quateirensis]|uniref:Competence damage inducible protein CinA n=1 Tax=Legionella quateirensis TaxID=45072 RepID=A0A378KQ78_9GAMM|nr:competence/damage-inducible protein A [Legionella quateirensis]KTD47832.1 competence damage inducible protein CinA [Legionella quateirensis]STY16725.1 Competence damage inducible protein CinA [Legionella quateirensis]